MTSLIYLNTPCQQGCGISFCPAKTRINLQLAFNQYDQSCFYSFGGEQQRLNSLCGCACELRLCTYCSHLYKDAVNHDETDSVPVTLKPPQI